MDFNVSTLMREASGSIRSYDIDEAVEANGAYQSAPRFKGKLKLVKTESGVWISAVLDSQAACFCSRCLISCTEPVHIEIEEEAFVTVDPYTGRKVPGPVDDADSVLIDQNHILDLSDAVMQYFTVGVPMKPVCKDDCPGLCATCGTDRNQNECDCDKVFRDSRWGPLLDLAPIMNLKKAE